MCDYMRNRAATSGMFLWWFHFNPHSEKHVTWCLCKSPPHFPQSSCPFQKGRERRDEGEKDHPHWDHSPSIRAFHTRWTWNNQSLIAAVCLEATHGWSRPGLAAAQSRSCFGCREKSFSLGCSERLPSFLSPATVLSARCLLYFKANAEIVSKISDDGDLKVILVL